jgi:hypothetical protein
LARAVRRFAAICGWCVAQALPSQRRWSVPGSDQVENAVLLPLREAVKLHQLIEVPTKRRHCDLRKVGRLDATTTHGAARVGDSSARLLDPEQTNVAALIQFDA